MRPPANNKEQKLRTVAASRINISFRLESISSVKHNNSV